jgi:hypothetical protein
MQGHWKMLFSKLCLSFFAISRVVSLQKEVVNFRKVEEESLAYRENILIASLPLA